MVYFLAHSRISTVLFPALRIGGVRVECREVARPL